MRTAAWKGSIQKLIIFCRRAYCEGYLVFFPLQSAHICVGMADLWQCCRAERTCLYLMPVLLGFAEICPCVLNHLTFPSFGKASSPTGVLPPGRVVVWAHPALLPLPQQTMGAGAPWVPGCRREGRDLLTESGNPHRYIEGHSNLHIFRNHPCNLCEGMKSLKDSTWLPARSPSPLVMSSKTHTFCPCNCMIISSLSPESGSCPPGVLALG